MGLNKYLKQIAALLDVNKRKCKKDKECLIMALQKLKEREESLTEKINNQKSSKQRKKLKDELKVMNAQRRKGEKILKKMES